MRAQLQYEEMCESLCNLRESSNRNTFLPRPGVELMTENFARIKNQKRTPLYQQIIEKSLSFMAVCFTG